MELFTKTLFFANLLIIFSVIYSPVRGETGCPPAEDVAPCVCTHRPTAILKCVKITNSGDIAYAFKNSKRYTYQEVHIQESVISFIPHEIFENTTVRELYVENMTMNSLFDVPPKSNDLRKLHIENSVIMKKFETQNYTYFTNLETFYIDKVSIRRLTSNITNILPKGLKQITLRRTNTQTISEGTFDDFKNLDRLVIDSNLLTNISRKAFPKPFNGRFLYLENNKLNALPEGLFNDMPNLQFLSLKNNQLQEVLNTAFGSRRLSIPYIDLGGNPLTCNCLLVWLIKEKPEILRGTCETPRRLNGKALQNLRPGDFNCARV